MENYYGTEENTYLLATFIIIIGFFVIFAFYLNIVKPFMEERDYLKKEMKRSDGEEYYHWKRKLKRLYLAYVPIIGRFFR